MRSFETNVNNDIFIRNGQLAIATDLSAVLKTCQQVAKAQLGEMVLAQDRGVPNFETVWTSRANIVQFEAFLRRVILSVEGVTGIRSLETIAQGDVLSYVAEIETIYGSGQINGV
jgi:hypothetical protein